MGYEPAFQALAKQTMVAKIHGGAARRRLMVVLNPMVPLSVSLVLSTRVSFALGRLARN